MQPAETRTLLIAATEVVICRERLAPGVTSRAIAAQAGVRLSAISYHFGSLEALVVATAERVIRRLNTERMTALQAAVDRARPAPPPIEAVIAALVGPSVRWSLDPTSAYPVFDFTNRMHALTARPELYHAMTEAVGHHIAFIAVLRRVAPWLSEGDIGWRINAALGIRSQVIRKRHRSEVLAAGSVDFDDPQAVIARMVEVIAPMFASPASPARRPGTPHLRPVPRAGAVSRIRTAT